MKKLVELSNYLEKTLGINSDFILIALQVIILLIIAKIVKFIALKVFVNVTDDSRKRYKYNKKINLIITLLTIVVLFFILDTYIENIITVISFISAAITFSLRDIIGNWFAGIYIKIKKPFQLEDRIEIDDKKGDVINIGDLSFEILEVGDRVNGEQSTGIIIHVPNSSIFSHPIKNYNKAFKYIWNEITVLVPITCDLEKTKEKLLEIINKNEVVKRIPKKMSNQVDDASLEYRIYYNKLTPIIYTRVVESHVELYIRYLVHPKKSRYVENEVWTDILLANKNKEIELYIND